MSFVHANSIWLYLCHTSSVRSTSMHLSHALTQFACTYLSLFFQYERLDDYDLTPHLEELAILRQTGLNTSQSMDRVLKRKKLEGDVQNLDALRAAAEAFPSTAAKVHPFPAQHMRLCVVLLWSSCDTREVL
jgi:hypothetical protein